MTNNKPFYRNSISEKCPNAETTFPTVDSPIVHDDESAVAGTG